MKSVDGSLGPVGDVHRHQQEPLAIVAEDQVGLAPGELEPLVE